MDAQRFDGEITAGPRGRPVIAVPFDPDAAWGPKAEHPVSGTVNGRRVRTRITPGAGGGWVLGLNMSWVRDGCAAFGDAAAVVIAPEGPQREDLAPDIAAALAASPAAGAFFDTLAQFYRRGYLRWIEATKRRPEVRAERIATVVRLLEGGVKERPR